MKLGDLAGTGHDLSESAARIDIAGLTADSRKVGAGFLFAALPGTQLDGAAFIPQAILAGASAILITQGSEAANDWSVPVIQDPDPRRALALMAARFFEKQPETLVAVTGTSGKSSIVTYVRQLWQAMGHEAASLGTIGVETASGPQGGSLTTPDPVALHETLAMLAGEGVTHLALEASSHGLQQRRLDGLEISAAAFTNLSRDHLDYHASFDDYRTQKLRLFNTVLGEGKTAVINADSDAAEAFSSAAKARAQKIISVGRKGQTLTLIDAARDGFAQRLTIEHDGKRHEVDLPLVGEFQASNALVAAGLCMACGAEAATVLPLLEHLEGAKGRLEHVITTTSGAPVFVDYSHKPDALEKALEALRPYADNRLVVVFGCGGDRDKGKRPEMGEIASRCADAVYVTDDNPRSEDPATIRSEILKAAPGAVEIGDRGEAIQTAIAALKEGDVLLVAGKGHETGQKIGNRVLPFSDHEAVMAAVERMGA